MTQIKQSVGRFSDLGIKENFLAILKQEGFDVPTPIQHQVIPGALQRKDVVGIAQTGTGKTLAFGIPMIQYLVSHRGQGLVIVPTRELALQVERSLKHVGASLGLRCVVVIGGVSKHMQIKYLKRNPHVVIATPGRLVDLMEQKACALDKVNTVILDEADRMLDVGFLPQIKRILQSTPKDRQTMLFSATMPKSISLLASTFMKMPLRIEIAPQGTTVENVEQEIFIVVKNNKMRLLDSLLDKYQTGKVLIFSRTKYGAKRIARDVRYMDHTATEMHSNCSQAQRKKALEGFTNGKFRVMVATDIAARGIDVKDIGLVINFDLPDYSEAYVHRIGRTGRAGRYGRAISFVTPSQKADVRKIERLIQKSIPVLSLPSLPSERRRPFHQAKRYVPQREHSTGRGYTKPSYQKKRQQSSHGRQNSYCYKR